MTRRGSADDLRDPNATSRTPSHVVVRYVGFVVLLGGLLAAVAIFVLAREDADAEAAAAITRQKMYEHNIALIGGKGAIYAVRSNEWLASLWHGTSLAYTIAVLAVAIAVACFGIARLMATPPIEERGPSEPS